MALSLVKGQTLSLVKSNGGKLTRVRIGLGWEVLAEPMDLDTEVFMCNNVTGKPVCDKDAYMIFYGQPKEADGKTIIGPNGAIVHHGDNRTGAGDGDDESIDIDFTKMDALGDVNELMVFVTIYEQKSPHVQNFGMLKEAYIRVYDMDTNAELCKYDLDANFPGKFSVQVGSFKKQPTGEWSFEAIGEGYDRDLGAVGKALGVPFCQ